MRSFLPLTPPVGRNSCQRTCPLCIHHRLLASQSPHGAHQLLLFSPIEPCPLSRGPKTPRHLCRPSATKQTLALPPASKLSQRGWHSFPVLQTRYILPSTLDEVDGYENAGLDQLSPGSLWVKTLMCGLDSNIRGSRSLCRDLS